MYRPDRLEVNKGKGSNIGKWVAELILLEVARRIIRKIIWR